MTDIAADPIILSDDDDRSQISTTTAIVANVSQDDPSKGSIVAFLQDGMSGPRPQSDVEDGEIVEQELQVQKRVSFAASVDNATTGNT